VFGSKRIPQHPELAEGMKTTKRRRRRRKELHLCQNLEALTWQVEKNM